MNIYKLKKILTNDEKKQYKKLKSDKKLIESYKRIIMYGYQLPNNMRIRDAINFENNYNINNEIFHKSIYKKLFKNIFLTNKQQKYKEIFSKNNKKSILYEDILNIIFSYYDESQYIYLVNMKNKYDYLIINNLNILKHLFYSNMINKIYRVNSSKISNNPNSLFNMYIYKLIYNRNLSLFSRIYFNNSIINDYCSTLISIKLFYYKNNIKNIKYDFINIANYNNMYMIKNFLKNKNLTKFEFYYINNIDFYDDHVNRILINTKNINDNLFLSEIYNYLINILNKSLNCKKNKTN